MTATSGSRRVVIVGGGFAGLFAARALRRAPVQVTLAKLETFPALVGLVERGVLDFPVVGVAKSGWGLEQFRDYATASLKLNKMDPTTPAAAKMLGLLRYVDGDLGDDATYQVDVAGGGPG